MRCPHASLRLMGVGSVHNQVYKGIIYRHSVEFHLRIEYTYSIFHRLFHIFQLFISTAGFFSS